MRWSKIDAPELDLEKTLHCGQVFHWEKFGAGFIGAIGAEAVMVEQKGAALRFCGTDRKTIADYFSLDHQLAKICNSFPRDPAMNAARDFCRGLRIIRQPKWECLATFICSSMKQVAHIRQISLALRKRFGAKRLLYLNQVYDFPSAKKLARTTEEELRTCGLGYRAANLQMTAKTIAGRPGAMEEWNGLPDEKLRARLCELPGVGAKVANCVMLFAFERTAAFPIDVWIERVLREKYFSRKRKVTSQRLMDFAAIHFGEHGGYAQQYLFHHARITGRRAAKID